MSANFKDTTCFSQGKMLPYTNKKESKLEPYFFLIYFPLF